MSTVYVTLNSVDVSSYVKPNTLRIVLRSTSGPASVSFVLDGIGTIPESGQQVQIYVDSTAQMLFGGIVSTVTQTYMAPGEFNQYSISCTDYRKLFDRQLVTEHYQNDYFVDDVTVDFIIQEIVDDYTDAAIGFTTNNVQVFTRIIDFKFNYHYPSDCLRELAETFNCEWYIDEDKDIHFFYKDHSVAPIEITDATMISTPINNFSIGRDNTQIRNRIYIQGGYTTSEEETVTFVGNGESRYWQLPYRPHDISIKVSGVTKTIGQENVDTGSYNYWYNAYERTLFCDDGTSTPGEAVPLAVKMKFEYPLLVQVDNNDSQTLLGTIEGGDGIYEYIVRDQNLESKDQSENYGYRELEKRSNPIIYGFFVVTDYYGFKPGQNITINLTDCIANGTYMIKRVTVDDIGNNILIYNVEFEGGSTDAG